MRQTTTMPGLSYSHVIITDDKRRQKGIDGAIDEALMFIRDQYYALCSDSSVGDGARFHLVLTIERPETGEAR